MTTHCSHCRAVVPAPPSRLLAAIVLALAYTVTLAMGLVYACLGPVGFMFLPLLVPGGIGLITAAHGYASHEPTCPACGVAITADTTAGLTGGLLPQPLEPAART